MQNFNVMLKDSGDSSIVVPNTGAFTSQSINNDNIVMPIATIILAVVAVLFITVFLYNKRRISHKVFDKQKNFIIKSKAGLILPIALILAFSTIALSINTKQSALELAVAATNTLSIETSDIAIEANLDEESVFKYAPASVKISTATDNGYTLTAYTKSTSLVSEDSETSIESIAGDQVVLTENTWGIALIEPTDETSTVWQPLSDEESNPTTLKSVSVASQKDDETIIYYGINVNDELDPGTYTTTIVYAAVAQPIAYGCEGNHICYDDNGANSPTTMGNQSIEASDTEVTLWASNFQRPSYGFAGWNTKADGTGTNYGPNETISFEAGEYSTEGLTLYARWILWDSTAMPTMQSFSAHNLCEGYSVGDVFALADERDGETYAIAKLADGNCWMIENLRLENDATIGPTNESLSQGYGGDFIGLADPEAPTNNFKISAGPNSLYTSSEFYPDDSLIDVVQHSRMPRYNNYNTSLTESNMSDVNQNIYSYGNYYSWAAAIANTNEYSDENTNVTTTSICPKGWRLPRGGDKTKIESNDNDFWNLIVTHLNNGTNPANYNDNIGPYYDGLAEAKPVAELIRKYPNNFIYAGFVYNSQIRHSGDWGDYQSSTTEGISAAYKLRFYDTQVNPASNGVQKDAGESVRCIVDN